MFKVSFLLAAQETDAVKKQYSKILDAYGCLGVLQQNSGELTTLYLVMITGCFSIGKIGDSEIFRITQTNFIPLHYAQNEERISEVGLSHINLKKCRVLSNLFLIFCVKFVLF